MNAGTRLHELLDTLPHPLQSATDVALRGIADDMEQAGVIGAALTDCQVRERAEPQNAEFWRRLAGSLRKAITMI